jgi:transcription antitermination protein NusB
MGSRRKARILAFQGIYSCEFHTASLEELLMFHWLGEERQEKLDRQTRTFSSMLISGVLENRETLDEEIRKKLEHWDFTRLSKVDLAILRLGSYELLFQPDVPSSVVIDEAVEIAREFGGEDSYRFVNGILDSIRRDRNEP